MKRPEIADVSIVPNPAYPSGVIKIAVKVEEVVIPTPEPQMYALPFVLGANHGGGF